MNSILIIIMYVTEVFLVKIILSCCLFQTIACSTRNSYDTTCVCTHVSTNGTFCWAYTCRTDQVTIYFSSVSIVDINSIKQQKSMSNLRIGDQILVNINSQGQHIYMNLSIYLFIQLLMEYMIS